MTNYVHLHIVMREDYDFAKAGDGWAVPTSLADLSIDVTQQETDEFGLGIPVRDVIVSGWIDADTLAKFRDEWIVDPDHAEPALGFLGAIESDGIPRTYADERHNFGPDEFNVGGWSPVLDVTLSIIGPDARPA